MFGWLTQFFTETSGCVKTERTFRITTEHDLDEITIPQPIIMSDDFIHHKFEEAFPNLQGILDFINDDDIVNGNINTLTNYPEFAVYNAKNIVCLCKDPVKKEAIKAFYKNKPKITASMKLVFKEIKKMDPTLFNYLLSR